MIDKGFEWVCVELARRTSLTQAQSFEFMDAWSTLAYELLYEGFPVPLKHLGRLELRRSKSRRIIDHFNDDEEYTIPEHWAVRFKPNMALKKFVTQKNREEGKAAKKLDEN